MALQQNDQLKAMACCAHVMVVMTHPDEGSRKDAERLLRSLLGPGWTTISALQWLTGNRGMRAMEALPDDVEIAGISKVALQNISIVAAELLDRIYAARRSG